MVKLENTAFPLSHFSPSFLTESFSCYPKIIGGEGSGDLKIVPSGTGA
jgi:hypothetical protein